MKPETRLMTVPELPVVFADVTPIPQEDGGPHSRSICRIDYPPDFVAYYDYFRAVLAADERSERAYALTTCCLQHNPANYTVWHFRRLCLQAMTRTTATLQDHSRLQDFIPVEMELAAQLGGDNPKNYQIWYHKRAILELMLKEDPQVGLEFCERDLDYTATVFEQDGKNYHSWSFRQWLVQTIAQHENVTSCGSSIWNKELEYADSLIQLDVRNNSAWNQRWFAAHKGLLQQPLSAVAAMNEAEYSLSKAQVDPYNESPWRYLIAILKERMRTWDDDDNKFEKVVALAAEFESKVLAIKQVLEHANRDPEGCPNLTSALIDLLEWKGDKPSIEQAIELCQKLGQEYDPIREKYWTLRCGQLEAVMLKLS